MVKFLKDFQNTIVISCVVLIGTFYVPVIFFLNDITDQSSLQTVSGQILEAKDGQRPNVKIELEDGRTEFFDFRSIYFGVKGWGTPALPVRVYREKLLPKLEGHKATIKIGYTRFALFEPRMKIWSIHSDVVDISFEEMKQELRNEYLDIPLVALEIIFFLIFLGLVVITIYADLRKRKQISTT